MPAFSLRVLDFFSGTVLTVIELLSGGTVSRSIC